MEINLIRVGKRHRKDLGDLTSLAESIRQQGLLHSIVVDQEGNLLCGARRLAACKALGWKTIAVNRVKVEGELQRLRCELDENSERQDFTPEEAVLIGEAIEAVERKAAKERQKEHGKTAPGKKADTCAKVSQVNGSQPKRQPEAATIAASAVNMSRPTYTKAKAVVQAARSEPAKYAPIVDEMNRTRNVDRAYKKTVKQQVADGVCEKPAKSIREEVNESVAMRWTNAIHEVSLLFHGIDRHENFGKVIEGWTRKHKDHAIKEALAIITKLESYIERLKQ